MDADLSRIYEAVCDSINCDLSDAFYELDPGVDGELTIYWNGEAYRVTVERVVLDILDDLDWSDAGIQGNGQTQEEEKAQGRADPAGRAQARQSGTRQKDEAH